ncbi:RNA pyrophosphohydrolase [Umboniibacter marinipuniceus]|uniref:RNA pyrophosphohydrolase n=1 Tax=Umboniibacter marinipuniceus TaxID=569599 RepID=A0A3M0A7E5_9GAMM|nr:RNA pyrophosphohydrolase [Umboniibacter marinipuniceus]RMA80214.1 putative (di)nucleoside polyphosphate hydrolase [Umboniibacter marinipuniceus]
MIDSDGFRPNVGIIITNDSGQVLWAQRSGQTSWQFPQGGIDGDESPREALYRELYEEVGLREDDVEIIGETRGWLRYRLPHRLIRHGQKPLCIGQKQKWFLLRLTAPESAIDLRAYGKPEFDSWKWVSYWYPLRMVVNFKREVYRRAMDELLPLLHRSLSKD